MDVSSLPMESFGVLLVVIFMLGVLVVFIGISQKVVLQETESFKQMDTIDYVYLVEKCLKQGSMEIREDFLKTVDPKNMCNICGLCGIETAVGIEDLSGGLLWGSPRSREGVFEILTNLESGDKTRKVRLYAEL